MGNSKGLFSSLSLSLSHPGSASCQSRGSSSSSRTCVSCVVRGQQHRRRPCCCRCCSVGDSRRCGGGTRAGKRQQRQAREGRQRLLSCIISLSPSDASTAPASVVLDLSSSTLLFPLSSLFHPSSLISLTCTCTLSGAGMIPAHMHAHGKRERHQRRSPLPHGLRVCAMPCLDRRFH